MFSFKLKNNKISLKKMIVKKNQKISIFGSNIYTDWHVILIFCAIVFVGILFYSYRIYDSVVNIENIRNMEEKNVGDQIVDVKKMNDVISEFNERANRSGGI